LSASTEAVMAWMAIYTPVNDTPDLHPAEGRLPLLNANQSRPTLAQVAATAPYGGEMSTLSLNLVSPPPALSRMRGPNRLTRARAANMGAVEQMKRAFAAGNRLSAFMGVILGGFIPIAVYALVHFEVADQPALWVMVVGGLAFSAISVFKWAESAFHIVLKALGFVVLLEGTVTFASQRWLSLAGLAILVTINSVSAAVALQAKE